MKYICKFSASPRKSNANITKKIRTFDQNFLPQVICKC